MPTKHILSAIADALPDDGRIYITKVEIHPGWGDIVNIRLHAPAVRSEAVPEEWRTLRSGISSALGEMRHSVDIVWEGLS
jgi:hypothetical protein